MTKQQAINILNGLEQSLDDYCELNNEGKAAFRMAIVALEVFGNAEQLPSAQPERKTGRWIKPTGMMPPEHHGHYECSECGAWAMRPWLRPWKGVVLTDFCPACGIQMRKEDDS